MRQLQFLPYGRRGDIELGRREETEEAGGEGRRVGGSEVRDERGKVKVCVKNSKSKNVKNHSWSYMAETKEKKA